MEKPVRIQRSRKHKMISPNGLPIICVTRPGKWGNPFKVGELWDDKYPVSQEQAVAFYKTYVAPLFTQTQLKEIRGKNLACWCDLKEKNCHARTLLSIANNVSLDQVV